MQISIIVIYNLESYMIHIDDGSSIADLKYRLEEMLGIPRKLQTLYGIKSDIHDYSPLSTLNHLQPIVMNETGKPIPRMEHTNAENKMDITPENDDQEFEINADILSNLPNEIQLEILVKLSYSEVNTCKQVCKLWKFIINDQFFYYKLYYRKFTPIEKVNENWQDDWTQVFENRYKIETDWNYEEHNKQEIPLRNVTALKTITNKATLPDISNDTLIAGSGKTLFIYDIEEMEVLRRLQGHTNQICSVIVQDNCIISSDISGDIILWNLSLETEALPWIKQSGELAGRFSLDDSVIAMDIQHDVFSACTNVIYIWDINYSFSKCKLEGNTETVCQVELDGNSVYSTNLQGYFKKWDMRSSDCVVTLFEATRFIRTSEHLMYSSNYSNGNISLWDLRFPTMGAIQQIPVIEEIGIKKFIYDGHKIISSAGKQILNTKKDGNGNYSTKQHLSHQQNINDFDVVNQYLIYSTNFTLSVCKYGK
eukprot:TRINITY_DN1464_c0_g2_i3.p1 TRINITY_DN1464_c0_g2~~TRINITY_DN1464_c0_g2_i3.p1  ORF type:complete len:481 (+),score=75.47 TRINITY_DN1464_c0_g2_i3:32-1474(+)